MHGRVLLTPLFCLLAPVAVIPLVLPDGTRMARGAGYLFVGATSVLWLAVAGWALWAANSQRHGSRRHPGDLLRHRRRAAVLRAGDRATRTRLTAADYLDYPRMRAVLTAMNNTPDGALLLPSGNYDLWDVVPAVPATAGCAARGQEDQKGPHTVFFTNLGMLGMNVGLDVRVDRSDRSGQPAGRAHRAARGRPHRPRQEPVPRLGGRRGAVPQDPAVHPGLHRRGLDRPGRGGAEVPGDRRDADLGPRPDGAAAVPVEPGARVRVHASTGSIGCRSTSSRAAAWMCPSRRRRPTLACRRRGRSRQRLLAGWIFSDLGNAAAPRGDTPSAGAAVHTAPDK